jgi:hypothetical protein
MKLPNDPTGRGGAAYLMLVYLFAYLAVIAVVRIATGLNIDDRQVECSASSWARAIVILSITAIALLLHMAIGYCYFQSNGEGPYGPLPKPRSRKMPKRTRLLPYVSNSVLFTMMILPVMLLVLPRHC